LLAFLDNYQKMSEAYRPFVGEKIVDGLLNLSAGQTVQTPFIFDGHMGNTTTSGNVSAYMTMQSINVISNGYIGISIGDQKAVAAEEYGGQISQPGNLWLETFNSTGHYLGSSPQWIFNLSVGNHSLKFVSGFSGQVRYQIYVLP
jgi:hypothetical protein